METQEVTREEVRLQAENIGGIEQTDITFDPGVTILTGRNATNRTSLLQSIMAVLGSERASLKGDADSGRVTLQIGDREFTRTLERRQDGVSFGGDPYLEDAELANFFAFLLESNEARQTVALGQDLREIIMRPIDANAIQAEITQLKAERDDIEDSIAERKSLKEQRPSLEQQRADLEGQIDETREKLENKREQLEEQSTDADEARAEESALDEKMQTVQQTRSQLDTTEFRLDSERESLDSLREERADLEAEYEELQSGETGDADSIDAELNRLRDQKQRLDAEMSTLQNVIQFNEEMLDGTNQDIAAALRGADSSESVTDQLLDEQESVVCWTCGSEVEEASIEETIDRLRDLRQSKYATRGDIKDELAALKERRSRIESVQERREAVERRLADVRAEIEQREEKVEEFESEREELRTEISRLEDEITELEKQDRSDVLDIHREVKELELELDRLESERKQIERELDDVETQLDEIAELETRRDTINDQLDELRTRIDRIEQQAVNEFNDHMDTVLDILDYDNLDRIWVERAQTDAREGRRKVTKTEFRLHIVRSTDDGVTYEDDFTHLSESEREVTGLIFALAGYLAHDVHEVVPFILLDSLEAIDAERIAALVEYIEAHADYLVVALLPEDAQALADDYQRITEI